MAAAGTFRLRLFQFSLYGFLKNQQYFAPFLILAFREKGLSFFQIGLLVGFRELCINLFEVPSGAVADLYGRRRAMIVSFLAYIASFLIFALSETLAHLVAAMFLFALGEVFRSGTHKAIIFDYLREHGLEDRRVRVYGYTRSWSQLGSALSALIAAALVFTTGRYQHIFYLCIIPYALNVVNFAFYPRQDRPAREQRPHLRYVLSHVGKALRDSWRDRFLRRLLLESCGFEGVFKVAKDYLQVLLKTAVVALPVLVNLDDRKRTALLIGAVYALLFVLTSISSRQAHRIVRWRGDDEAAATSIWIAALAAYVVLTVMLKLDLFLAAIPIFVALHLLQNVWRPVLVSRLNSHSQPEQAATILSIETQSKSAAAMLIAPLLGAAVDHAGLYPVPLLGCVIAAVALIRRPRNS